MFRPAKIPLVFLLVTFSILVVQMDCHLSSQSVLMGEAIEEAKGKNREKGIDLQPVHRNVKTCQITTFQALDKPDQPVGMPCKVPQMCIANKSSVEDLALLDGQIEITSALSCQCIDPHHSCHRQSNRRVCPRGTKYEKTVDVGGCVGACNKKGKKPCQSIASKIVNVKDPNVAHCMEKVVNCGCARSCYRESFYQLHSATIFHEQTDRNKTLEQIELYISVAVLENAPKEKRDTVFTGSMTRYGAQALPRHPKCVCFSSPPKEAGAKCRPRSLGERVLFAGNGAPNTVNVIKRCKCY